MTDVLQNPLGDMTAEDGSIMDTAAGPSMVPQAAATLTTTSFVARILDAVRIQTAGAMDGTLRFELFNVFTEFCQRSNAWHAEVLIPVQYGMFLYEIPTPVDTGQVNRLLWLEGQRPSDLNPSLKSTMYSRGPQRQGHLLTAGSNPILEIEVSPASSETWHAHFALAPMDPTDTNGLPILPSWIASKYHDYLASGLLMRLCAHPKKPYTNPELAAVHGRKFYTGISLAEREARTGYMFDGQRWSFPQTFRTRSQRMAP